MASAPKDFADFAIRENLEEKNEEIMIKEFKTHSTRLLPAVTLKLAIQNLNRSTLQANLRPGFVQTQPQMGLIC